MVSARDLLNQVNRDMERLNRERREQYARARANRLARQAASAPQQPQREVVVPNVPDTAPVTAPVPDLAVPEANRQQIDFGSFFGSGVLENLASGAQSFSETAGGTLANLATRLTPGEQEFERKFAEVEAERGSPGFFDIKEAGELRAEAFRRTDFPTLDLPGGGFDLMPGKGEFKILDTIGVKGALELTPDAALALATGGGSALGGAIARGSVKGAATAAGRIGAETLGVDVAVAAGTKAFRWTSAGLAAASKADNVPVVGRTGVVAGYMPDDEALRRSGVEKTVMDVKEGEEAAAVTALVRMSEAGATVPVEAIEQATVYTKGNMKGPLRWAMEKVAGFQSVFDPNNLLHRALFLFVSKEQESIAKVAQAVNPIRARLRGLFDIDKDGNVLTVGVSPGTMGKVPGPDEVPGAFVGSTAAGRTKAPGGRARRVETAGEPLPGDVPPDIDPSTFQRSQTGSMSGRAKKVRVGPGVTVESVEDLTLGSRAIGAPPSLESATRRISLATSQVFEDLFDTGKANAGDIDSLRELRGRELEVAQAWRKERGLEADIPLYKNDKHGYVVSREQAEAVQFVHNVIEDTRGLMELAGVKWSDVITSGRGSRYTPRRVIGGLLAEVNNNTGGRAGIGRTESFAKSRSYVGQAIETGRDQGIVYEGDMGNVMEAYLTGVYRAIREKQLADSVKTLQLKNARVAQRTGIPVKAININDTTPPAFRGMFFEEATAKQLEKIISPPGDKIKAVSDIADVVRTLRASSDFSAPFIQGIVLLARNPVQWAKGLPKMFAAFWDENYYNKWFQGNIDDILRATNDQVVINGSSEFFAGLEPLQRGFNKIPLIGRKLSKGFSNFERAFTFYGDYARLEMFKALEDTVRRSGDANAMADMVDFVNKSTGVFRPGALIQSPSQQAVERMFVFFAPRYTRAAMSLVTDITKGGMKGELARTSLMRLAAGGIASYALAAQALGQEPEFDPAKPNFLRLKVGSDWIGVGTVWRSMVTLAADLYTDPALQGRIDESQLLFMQSRFGEKGLSKRVQDNPLVRWVRSRTSVVSGTSIDIMNGHDFIGNPIEGGKDIATHVAGQATPFILEDLLFAQPRRSGPVGATSSFFGLSSFPLSMSTRRNELQDKFAVAEHGVLWQDLNRLQRERLIERHDSLATVIEEARRDRVSRGRDIDVLVQEWFDTIDNIREDYSHSVGQAYQALLAEPEKYDLVTFRRTTLKEFGNRRRAAIEAMNKNERYAPVREWFAETQEKRAIGDSPERPEDIAYNEYLAKVAFNEDFDDVSGEFDFDSQRKADLEFRETWGQEVYDYVQTRLNEGKDQLPIVEELYKGRRQFSYYWGSVDDPNTSIGAVISNRPDPILAKQLYQTYVGSSEVVKKEMEATSSELRRILTEVGKVRAALRRKVPELDVFLTRWGYTSKLLHPENQFDGAHLIVHDPRERPFIQGVPDFTISGSRRQVDVQSS